MSDPDGDDAERALAVLDRLLQRPWPTNEVRLWRGLGGSYTACIHRLPDAVATGPTPAAALLALGQRLEGQNGPERDERGA